MIRKKTSLSRPIIIDLTGPDGSVFALISLARKLAKKTGIVSPDTVVREMIWAGDYENLIQVFDGYFGSFVILER